MLFVLFLHLLLLITNLNSDKSQINSNDNYIPVELLRWASWSRAGQWVYKSEVFNAKPEVLKPNDVITANTPLAIRNEMDCNENTRCQSVPAGQYGTDSPVWDYFQIKAPEEAAPAYPYAELTE